LTKPERRDIIKSRRLFMRAPIAEPVRNALNDSSNGASRDINKPIKNRKSIKIGEKDYTITNTFPKDKLYSK
jgi:hypothetical protein